MSEAIAKGIEEGFWKPLGQAIIVGGITIIVVLFLLIIISNGITNYHEKQCIKNPDKCYQTTTTETIQKVEIINRPTVWEYIYIDLDEVKICKEEVNPAWIDACCVRSNNTNDIVTTIGDGNITYDIDMPSSSSFICIENYEDMSFTSMIIAGHEININKCRETPQRICINGG